MSSKVTRKRKKKTNGVLSWAAIAEQLNEHNRALAIAYGIPLSEVVHYDKENVRRIGNRALAKLRERLEARGLDREALHDLMKLKESWPNLLM